MTVQDIIAYLQHKKTHNNTSALVTVTTPWKLKPWDFLDFAKLDLRADDPRSCVNALSNAKRALDCQIHSILFAFGLYNISQDEDWGFKRKIDTLKRFHVAMPRILRKVTDTRNLMEHDYMLPGYDQVEDFVDVAALFVEATNRYLFSFNAAPSFVNLDISDPEAVHASIDFEDSVITVNVKQSGVEEEQRTTVKAGGDEYMELLQVLLNFNSFFTRG